MGRVHVAVPIRDVKPPMTEDFLNIINRSSFASVTDDQESVSSFSSVVTHEFFRKNKSPLPKQAIETFKATLCGILVDVVANQNPIAFFERYRLSPPARIPFFHAPECSLRKWVGEGRGIRVIAEAHR